MSSLLLPVVSSLLRYSSVSFIKSRFETCLTSRFHRELSMKRNFASNSVHWYSNWVIRLIVNKLVNTTLITCENLVKSGIDLVTEVNFDFSKRPNQDLMICIGLFNLVLVPLLCFKVGLQLQPVSNK